MQGLQDERLVFSHRRDVETSSFPFIPRIRGRISQGICETVQVIRTAICNWTPDCAYISMITTERNHS